ncbi:DUF6210 family protein [Actinacidiphila glaucinigra]|uniref:DUF6210 family protein n=1 Tax=Actinacidiphila glaucinigra TaxID=235986 RepID=UPI0038641045
MPAGTVEGFLPLFGPDGSAALRELFEKDFRGAGTWNHPWPDDERDSLRGAIGAVRHRACDGTTEGPRAVRPVESRICEADEAWVPVIAPDGPAVPVWFDSGRNRKGRGIPRHEPPGPPDRRVAHDSV